MRIGISFDVKGEAAADDAWKPDDLDEEFDSPETIEAIAAVLEPEFHELRIIDEVNRTHELMAELVEDTLQKRPISVGLLHNIATTSGVPICQTVEVLLLPAIERMVAETIRGRS